MSEVFISTAITIAAVVLIAWEVVIPIAVDVIQSLFRRRPGP